MTTLKPDWLSTPEVKTLVAAFDVAGAPVRFVGGCVRDALLGHSTGDIDAATPLPPDRVMELLRKASIRAIPTGLAHGTVTAVINKRHFEITTLRRDVVTDGRHAEIAYTENWEEDARRRDFTINALYLSPKGELFDYGSGVQDAQKGVVRFIGDASMRIREDYLRILRFFRFHARYGKGAPDVAAIEACANLAPGMKQLSGERVQDEFFKLLSYPAHAALCLMQEKNILKEVLGVSLSDLSALEKMEKWNDPQASDSLLKLAALLSPLGEKERDAVLARLRASNADARLIRHVTRLPEKATQAEQDALYRRLGPAGFFVSVVISAPGDKAASYKKMLATPRPQLPVSGNDLAEIGMKPGREMGALLRTLQETWAESDYTLTREALLEKAKKLI